MNRYFFWLLSVVLGGSLLACQSTMQLTQEQVRAQQPTMATLEKELDSAKLKDIHLLAPNSYKTALEFYVSAYLAAQNKDKTEAEKTAAQGMKALKLAFQKAIISEPLFVEVLDARKRAIVAGANEIFPKDLEATDEDLASATKLVETGNNEKAKKRRNEIQQAYLDLELRALKTNTVSEAKNAIERATTNGAKKLAPKTLAKALESLTLAQSALEIDRTNRKRANEHAHRAKVLANRSSNIAILITRFKQLDFSQEDSVLDFQQSITKIGALVGVNMEFDQLDGNTMAVLAKKIQSLLDENSENIRRIQQLDEQIERLNDLHKKDIAEHQGRNRQLEDQMANLKFNHQQELIRINQGYVKKLAQLETDYTGEITILSKTQREQKARFDRIQTMFTATEANVFRQKNNVLISVHGFNFPSGSAEIRPDNFALMKRIIKAISEFQYIEIQVSGHTDSTGSANINKKLSQSRADSVRKFLIEVGALPAIRIKSQGFGEGKPVANNQSEKGRAQNRRVEILIVNEG